MIRVAPTSPPYVDDPNSTYNANERDHARSVFTTEQTRFNHWAAQAIAVLTTAVNTIDPDGYRQRLTYLLDALAADLGDIERLSNLLPKTTQTIASFVVEDVKDG